MSVLGNDPTSVTLCRTTNASIHLVTLTDERQSDTVSLASTGAPLGLLPAGLLSTETLVQLRPGDSIVLYSDRVVDAQNAVDEEFGEERRAHSKRGRQRRVGARRSRLQRDRRLRRRHCAVRRHHDPRAAPVAVAA